MLKYIFMGTPGIAAQILEKLCEKEYVPSLVITQLAKPKGRGYQVTPSEVERFARTQDLNVMETLDINAPAMVNVLKTFHPDLILVVAFGQILKEPILKLPRLGCFNLHASLLPKFRGAAPVQRAILEGEKETGVTLQRMVKKLDAGDVFLQKKCLIEPEETSGELLHKLGNMGGDLVLEAFSLWERGEGQLIPQDESLATYAKKLEKSESDLDLNQTAQKLHQAIRAFQPWPVAQISFFGEKLRIFRAEVVQGDPEKLVGFIDSDRKTYLRIQCGGSEALSLEEVQQEGRKRLEIRNFLQGFRWPSD